MSSLLTTHFFTSTASFKCEENQSAPAVQLEGKRRTIHAQFLATCHILF